MPIAKKGQRFGGRAKGTQNKLTRSSRTALTLAFDGLGGVDGLVAWAEKNQSDFYRIWAKLVPREVQPDVDGPVQITVVRVAAPQPVGRPDRLSALTDVWER